MVISDTSPLNYLILLGHVEVLPPLFEQIVIPEAVLSELRHPETPFAVKAWAATPPSWISVSSCLEVDQSLPRQLGRGEREAISLALRSQTHKLLIDERAGRSEALLRGLQVAGVLAVLLEAGLRDMLNLPDALYRLRQHGFRATDKLVAGIMDRYERKTS